MAEPYRDAILDALEKTWDLEMTEAPPGNPDGKYLFARIVDRGGDAGWDDWHFVGRCRPDGYATVELAPPSDDLDPEDFRTRLSTELAPPLPGFAVPFQGKFVAGPVTIWWCRSDYPDGPSRRVADWSNLAVTGGIPGERGHGRSRGR